MRGFRLIAMIAAEMLALAASVPTAAMASQATPAAAGASPAATPAATEHAPLTTAMLVGATNAPLRVAGSDGSDHLDYDLIITNAFPAPITLTAIDALAPDGTELLHLAGDALAVETQPLPGGAPTTQVPASGAVAVVMDVIVPHGRAEARLTHRISYTIPADTPVRTAIGAFTVTGPALPVDPRPATIIAPPLHGDNWVVANGCCSPVSGHRVGRLPVDGTRLAKPEMFAIDFVQMRNGQIFSGDGATADQWYDFGSEVLAVANGKVVDVRDDMPEELPNKPVQHLKQPGDYGGNHVTIEIKPGVYAFYAHMQPGSITVKIGDQVKTGQVIGKLGNSGNTTGPHLHFGLLDYPDPLTGNSMPMVFDRYTLVGMINIAASASPSGGQSSLLQVVGTLKEQTATLPLYTSDVNFR